ncbi:MAG TPA: HEAT repeat domain-containing protein [Anaerolineae bacterium]|nr:HEAT repeat domain-containing protein [Anaerolineae bacterium]
MMITSSAQAMEILDDVREEVTFREAAIRYLAKEPTPAVTARLVQALQDDDFSVRWEAAIAVTQLGVTGVLEVLKALTDPERVGDPRLRDSAYHILHLSRAAVPVSITDLLGALKGQAADIASLVEANHVLRNWKKYQLAEARAARQAGTKDATKVNIPGPKYAPARLTGDLGRLAKH